MHAQLATFSFTGAGSCPTQNNIGITVANCSVTPFTRSNVTCVSSNDVFNSRDWPTATMMSTAHYIEVTVAATAGYIMNLTSVSFKIANSTTGPTNARISNNAVDAFLTGNSVTVSTTYNSVLWDFTDFSTNPGGSVSFRIFAWGAVSSSGTMRITDFNLYGTITANPIISYDLINQNIGIGNLPSTNYKLDVFGKLNVRDQLFAKNNLFVYNSNGRPSITLKNDNGETPNPENGGLVAGSAFGGGILFGNNWDADVSGGVSKRYLRIGAIDNNYVFTPVISIPSESLNVGIGTLKPAAKLDISTGNGSEYLRMSFASDVRFRNYLKNQWDGGDVTKNYISFNVSNGAESEGEVLRLIGNGNVLIGKTIQNNTAYKLDVGGIIRANKVVVNTTGADFVFDPSYKLLPLKQVEIFINKNKHLPGIFSAKEMQKDGIELADQQTKLLQKIEELTLYIIEQNKRAEELSEKLKALEFKFEKLVSDKK